MLRRCMACLGCMGSMELGSAMMLCVAAMWSVTASLDKLGVLHAPSVWVYFALQRLFIGTACAVYMLLNAPQVWL